MRALTLLALLPLVACAPQAPYVPDSPQEASALALCRAQAITASASNPSVVGMVSSRYDVFDACMGAWRVTGIAAGNNIGHRVAWVPPVRSGLVPGALCARIDEPPPSSWQQQADYDCRCEPDPAACVAGIRGRR